MKRATVWAPLVAAVLAVLYFLAAMASHRESADRMQLSRFAGLPVLDGGRVKPIDSYARVQLMVMNRKQTYYDEFEHRQPAVRWMLGLLAEGLVDSLRSAPLQVHDPEVQQWLGLESRPAGLYTPREVLANEQKSKALLSLLEREERALTPVERKALGVARELHARAQQTDEFRKARQKQVAVHRNWEDVRKRGELSRDTLDQAGAPEYARVFRIDNDQLLAMLNLEAREGFRYSIAEMLGEGEKEIYRQAPRQDEERGRYFQQFILKANQARQRPEKERDLVDVKAVELQGELRTYQLIRQLDGVLMVPGSQGGTDGWKTLWDALMEGDQATNPSAASLERIVRAYALGDTRDFNREVEAYHKSLRKDMPAEMSRVSWELWFNNFAPFFHCFLLYAVALVLALVSWLVWHEPLRRSALALAVVLVVVHTLALGLRMYLTGRPPVTNLYSSAVFIGWGAVLLCLVIEQVFRNSIALVVASVLGFATMFIAHHLGGSGDTMEVLQAVLDTNFWLATHVTTVTLGYTATFVAGFLASVFIFLMLATTVRAYFLRPEAPTGKDAALFAAAVAGLVALPAGLVLTLLYALWVVLSDGEPLTAGVAATLGLPLVLAWAIYVFVVYRRRMAGPPLDAKNVELPSELGYLGQLALTQSSSKILATMIYGVVCFATLLSFVGTVLGGIWADQSWGRFWGWDPKENGALLIVVMNALILHARWGGMIRERGLAVLAIVGNMVTAWSWFGTNQLGVGLHAYGFNNTLAQGCAIFWMSQLCVVGLGLMPLRFWRAYADAAPLAVTPAPVPPGPRLKGGRGGTGIQPG